MNMPMQPSFVCPSESAWLGARVCGEAGFPVTPLEERRYEGGEFKLRPLESVRGRTVIAFQSLAGSVEVSASERLLRLLFLLNGLRDAGARQRIAVIPYMAFARKDRRTQPRDPVNMRYVAEFLEATGVDRVVALDVHNAAALDNAFRIPVDHLSVLPMMAHHFAAQAGGAKLVVVSPDVGGIKRVQLFHTLLEAKLGREAGIAFMEKRRAGGVVSGETLVGDVSGCTVIVVDDLCATGGTLLRAASACRKGGAAEVHVAVTHAPLREGIETVSQSDVIASMVITDSVALAPHDLSSSRHGKLVTLSVAPLLGQALQRICGEKPLAAMLTRWPLSPND
jgi:ribose-phosphate pyrophosphokinase